MTDYRINGDVDGRTWFRVCTERLKSDEPIIRESVDPIWSDGGRIEYFEERHKENRLRVDKTGGAWCPKQQVERGVREYLQVDLGDVYVLTGVETQGRYDRGRGQEYAEEYMIEYWRPGLDEWKQYSRWDGKQVATLRRADPLSKEFYRLCID
ncbi:hypothetical protein B7P43_G07228 [Cryptotermes secundus]|uniref:F5/8 type C domain-containing protein n=1 Tax=Cryptotermes secundus TaxID=105785 RepID=A0A2J7QZ57_9NEOP|nr:hypothetical protein B7P43_G07228 [Cryptotermes secundus]